MLNAKQAAEKAKRANKGLVITHCCDYDNDYYIFTMLENKNKRDINDPFYAVSKKDGSVYNFSPSGDFAKFAEAMEKRSIPINLLR